jgi:hypothetical protein
MFYKVDKRRRTKELEETAAGEFEAGAGQSFGAAFNLSFKNTRFGKALKIDQLAAQQDEKLKQEGFNITTPKSLESLPFSDFPDFSARKFLEDTGADKLLTAIDNNRAAFEDLQQQKPELGLQSYDTLSDQFDLDYAKVVQRANRAWANSSVTATAAYAAGRIGGFAVDPLFLATLPVSAGAGSAGVGFLRNFGAIGAREAALSTLPIGLNKATEIENREAQGEEVSTTRAITEGAVEVLGAGLLGGAAGAALFKALPKGIVARNPAKEIDEAIPAGVTKEEHLTNVNKEIDSLAREPEPTNIKPEILEDELIDTASDFPTLRQQLDENDIILKDGDTEVSLGKLARELEQEEKQMSAIETCLKGGTSGT